ncbi:MAG: 1-(5-phosphoribosyl)-5-[(5-phosphoribosylamino)methylideneamino]imidazole-4-carboxamide isomerase [Rhodobacteraceae bacterium]|nr:1-(5-phosphoribosyl)-5-[(5-phosphoribosylamino)methylideneamino]imidazole-4-carboxamide isomerase [Paracoccaceae bacterium]MCY4249776.1 1-(5-phosphoribosyl)-5-[(5-phosphoribosylamino)methylideneamino]imidazole-4-carboxamide isomerase [Paracoccaceae bacterium]
MIVYPAIDVMDGKCVRLYKGDFGQQTTYGDSPEDVAVQFRKQGAKWLHLIDLDGARTPENRQLKVIKNITCKSEMRVQTGGGIRSVEEVASLLDTGVGRVIIGSLATKEPEMVKGMITRFGPDKICLAADVQTRNGDYFVAISGWQELSQIPLRSFIKDYLGVGLKHVLCTDISRDGTLKGCNVNLCNTIQKEFPEIDLQASGGVGSLDDLKQLSTAGVIVGKALYEGTFTLAEALEAVC